jgi:NAD(P)-dependent dehydrogenase (short-subunit alcohol dehydrogenase family)
VYICDFNDSNLQTHKRELSLLYPNVEVHVRKFDAAHEEAVKAVVEEAIKAYGRLDIFFANAGVVGQIKLFTDISAEEFLSTLRTNVVRSVIERLLVTMVNNDIVSSLQLNMLRQP